MAVKVIETYGANRHETFAKIRVGCRGAVIRDSRMLISYEKNVDFYSIPGGGLESGETLEECCIREVSEETGYIIKPSCHFLTMNEYYEDVKYISHYFTGEIIGESERSLTASETERGLVPEWRNPEELLEIFSRHNDFAATNEDKCGAYLREFIALSEYSERCRQGNL